MRRLLGPMSEANVWANIERILRTMLVVQAAGYTMRQIAQHWKHPLKWDKKTDNRPITFQRQCWKLAVRHISFAPWLHDLSNASSVQHWKYLTHRVAAALLWLCRTLVLSASCSKSYHTPEHRIFI